MKNKKCRYKIRKNTWLTDVPFGVCIFFIVFGVVLGSVFTIGTWYWGKPIDREEAIEATATFESFDYIYGRYGGVSEICVTFSDFDKLYIDGAVYSDDVEASLQRLVNGDNIVLLMHPNSGNIWEMKTEEYTVLSFEDAKSCMLFENYAFSVVLGSFCFFCALLGAASLIVRFVDYRKNNFLAGKR